MRYLSVTSPANVGGTTVVPLAVAFPTLGSDGGKNIDVGNTGVTRTSTIRAGERENAVSRFVIAHMIGARTEPVQAPPVA